MPTHQVTVQGSVEHEVRQRQLTAHQKGAGQQEGIQLLPAGAGHTHMCAYTHTHTHTPSKRS